MGRWLANITQSMSKRRNVGGVGMYVYRPRWRGSGHTTGTSVSVGNVCGYVGKLVQKKMPEAPSSADCHDKIPKMRRQSK